MTARRGANPVGFAAVGSGAALIHLGGVLLLVECFAYPPLKANVAAFIAAFIAGHIGHRRFTFAAQRGFGQSLWRWGMVSSTGFVCNQYLYWLALRLFPRIHYELLLALVTLLIAALSYGLGKFWAFKAA